ncbi:MAG TPA: phosphoglycerate dehydrogenase [Alphaproteobacteria bacterium]|jgi:D-3-phosphoglycerate dehydrogenase|nr:phosphoglycerate dehydrogenase [Alphaproteobacteria bacterium]HIK87327.1 phosphoglycerate dehydrogenase [Alphaproteobacteria bacterium]
MPKVLISDKLSKKAEEIFKKQGIEVTINTELSPEDLSNIINDFDGLAIRSTTKVTSDIIKHAKNLKVIGRAGIGVDNVDIESATANGIIVMNTPFGNSITTAEHTIALMMSLARNIPIANTSTHLGKWEKSKYTGTELYSKVLGMIGCGNIGSIVADRAKGLKMHVKVYDPYLTEERAIEIGVDKINFEELLKVSDFITLHVPLTKATKEIINASSINKMKKGVKIINCARGGLVNEEDLAYAIESGKVSGAAFDVFSNEPAKSNVLFGLEQMVVTPHLGASTEEAQENVAIQVAEQMSNYLISGAITNALNIPSISSEDAPKLKPYIKLAEQIGKLAGQITETSIKNIKIEFGGQVALLNTEPLTSVLIAGLLSHSMEAVNVVNAQVIAKNRNMNITTSSREKSGDYITDISLTVETERRTRNVIGTLYGNKPRIVGLMNTRIEAELGPNMLFITNEDKPGFIGTLGSILSDANINIATFHLGRTQVGGDAIALIEIDEPVSSKLIKEINEISQVKSAKALTFAKNII